EGDAGLVTLAPAAEDFVATNFITAANAAIAEDAGVVVHGDDHRGIIVFTMRRGLSKPGRVYAKLVGILLQLAVTLLLLLCAGSRMVGHQQLGDDLDRRTHAPAGAVGGDNHARFHGPITGGGEAPFFAAVLELDVDGANPAHPHGTHILAVAQSGDVDLRLGG